MSRCRLVCRAVSQPSSSSASRRSGASDIAFGHRRRRQTTFTRDAPPGTTRRRHGRSASRTSATSLRSTPQAGSRSPGSVTSFFAMSSRQMYSMT
jgi:hypothetical protein